MKQTTIQIDIKQLDKGLQEYVNKVCANTAGQLRDELVKEAKSSMEEFYSWKPKYYYRHENFLRKGYRPYYHNQGNKIWGGVELPISLIPNVYQDPVQEVADYVYHGLHGPASIHSITGHMKGTAPIMKPSPLERLYMKQDELVNDIQKYVNKGMKSIGLKLIK